MNDVLPKPFTKEGLLSMLEKHLTHLKKQPPGLDIMPPPLNSTKRSMKSEDSPATSPATGSTWNSPNQIPGGSPAVSNLPDDPYMNQQYGQPGMQAPPQHMYASQGGPPGNMAMPPQQRGPPMAGPPRRGIDEISGGPGMQDAKRPMYAPPPPGAQMPPHMQQPMPPHMQRPPR